MKSLWLIAGGLLLVWSESTAVDALSPRAEFVRKQWAARRNATVPADDKGPVGRIIGGDEVSEFQYPWLLPLLYEYNGGSSWNSQICGATLVLSRWAVTAAHCTEGSRASDFHVEARRHNLATLPSSEGSKRIGVQKIYQHQNYNSNTMRNDIALLYLSEAVTPEFSTFDNRIEMEKGRLNSQSGSAWVAGWGNMAQDGETPEWPVKPRHAELSLVGFQACNLANYGEVHDNTMICAEGNGDGTLDTCQGDSGGPLFIPHPTKNNKYVLLGVTSWGYGCGSQPGMYARVSQYTNWMESKVGANRLPFVDFQCSDITREWSCKSPHGNLCRWRSGQCEDKPPPRSCSSAKWFSKCRTIAGCRWNGLLRPKKCVANVSRPWCSSNKTKKRCSKSGCAWNWRTKKCKAESG